MNQFPILDSCEKSKSIWVQTWEVTQAALQVLGPSQDKALLQDKAGLHFPLSLSNNCSAHRAPTVGELWGCTQSSSLPHSVVVAPFNRPAVVECATPVASPRFLISGKGTITSFGAASRRLCMTAKTDTAAVPPWWSYWTASQGSSNLKADFSMYWLILPHGFKKLPS